MAASHGVILDACILIKASVRDTFVRAHIAGIPQLRWTRDILGEVERNLADDRLTTVEGASRLATTLRSVLDGCEVTGYETLVAHMTNDPKDRHVLAAAVASGSQLIVTDNVRDFVPAAIDAHGIDVQTADDCLVELFHRHPEIMTSIDETQASVLRRPPRTTDDVLDMLERSGAPEFAARVRAFRRIANE